MVAGSDAGKRFGKVLRFPEAMLALHADEYLIVNAPAAPPPTAAAVLAAGFLDCDEQDLQRKSRIPNEGGDTHQFIKDVEQAAALGRTTTAQHGLPVALQAHDPLLLSGSGAPNAPGVPQEAGIVCV